MAENQMIIEQRLTDLERRVTYQEEKSRDQAADIKELDKRLDQQDQFVSRVEITIEGLSDAVKGLDKKFDKFIEKQEQEKTASQRDFKSIAFEVIKILLIGILILLGFRGAADWLGLLPGFFK